MKQFLKRSTILFCILFIIGALSFGLGLLSGGDALDGIAGGPKENTASQDHLINWGAILGVISLTCLLLTVIALSILKASNASSRSSKNQVFWTLMASVLTGLLLLLLWFMGIL